MNPEALFTEAQLVVARAIADGDPAAMRAAARGVDLDAPGRDGASLILFALWCAREGEPERVAMITELVLAGASPFRVVAPEFGSALDVALCSERASFLGALLDAGVSPDARITEGASPLLRFVIYGPTRAQRELLLARGAEVDAQDAMGRTAVFWALCEGELDTVDALLDHGANAWVIDRTGDSFGGVLHDLIAAAAPGSEGAARLSALRDRVVRMGLPWPPASPEAERARMRAAGIEPVVPHGAAATA
jgi:hypothetical protein